MKQGDHRSLPYHHWYTNTNVLMWRLHDCRCCCCNTAPSLYNACLRSTHEGTSGRKQSVLLLSFIIIFALLFQYILVPLLSVVQFMDWASSKQCSFRPQNWGKSWMNHEKENTIWWRNFSLFLKLFVYGTCMAWVGCRTIMSCHIRM